MTQRLNETADQVGNRCIGGHDLAAMQHIMRALLLNDTAREDMEIPVDEEITVFTVCELQVSAALFLSNHNFWKNSNFAKPFWYIFMNVIFYRIAHL